jgi:excisionase family DNA binding protein
MKELLSKRDVAEFLQVSTRQVQRWIAQRKIRALRLGHKTVRIRREDLDRYLTRSQQ